MKKDPNTIRKLKLQKLANISKIANNLLLNISDSLNANNSLLNTNDSLSNINDLNANDLLSIY